MTTIKGILVPSDDDVAPTVVEFEQGDLAALQRFVGGYVQFIDGFRPNCTFVINEEGKNESLPVNRRGTLALWVHHSEFMDRDFFVGDVLILGPADEKTGDTTGAPDELIELLFNTERYKYLVQVSSEQGWHGNGMTYENWVEAYNGALGLAKRWVLVERVKVVAA